MYRCCDNACTLFFLLYFYSDIQALNYYTEKKQKKVQNILVNKIIYLSLYCQK